MSSKLCRYLGTSIVKKQVMALTGLLLFGFLITHLAANLLIIFNAEAYNIYSHKLITNPFIYALEAGLAGLFLLHIGLAIKLVIENKSARPESYFVKRHTGRGATFASSTMPYTGLIVLVFLVLHIWHLKFGAYYSVTYDGVEMRDLHRLVMEYFSVPLNVGWYIFAMIALGLHLSHGLWSAFQSFGFNHPKYNCCLRCGAKIVAALMALGFAAIPVWCYLQGGQL